MRRARRQSGTRVSSAAPCPARAVVSKSSSVVWDGVVGVVVGVEWGRGSFCDGLEVADRVSLPTSGSGWSASVASRFKMPSGLPNNVAQSPFPLVNAVGYKDVCDGRSVSEKKDTSP